MQSKVFRKFKNEMGQANHYFITIIVGLFAVKNGADKDPTITECWNPEDVTRSVDRSKIFTKKAALAWCVDNVEMYFRLVNRTPILLSEDLKNKIDGSQKEKQSVSEMFKVYCDYFPSLDMTQKCLVKLLLNWRNNMVHFDADNTLPSDMRKHLLSLVSPNPLIDKYHLDTKRMLDNFDNGKVPSNKELETMISYTIHFVEELDRLIVEQAPKVQYVDSLIAIGLKEGRYTYSYATTDNDDKKVSILKKWLNVKYSISDDFYNEELDNHIRKIVSMKKSELSDYINSNGA